MTNAELALMCQAMELVLALRDGGYSDKRRIRAPNRARARMHHRVSMYLQGGLK